MALLNKAAILAADDLTYRDVEVPEWGGTVRVRALSGTDRDAYEAMMIDARQQKGAAVSPKLHNFRSKLVVRAIVDSNGERLFTDTDARELGAKSGAVIDRLFDIAAELSGMDKKAVERAEGNSDAEANGSSTTD
jgi:hypothetical protein